MKSPRPHGTLPPMIKARRVVKRFEAAGNGSAAVQALNGVDLDVADGEAVALMGASGSGKSTLLHLLGGLDAPTSGSIEVGGLNLEKLNDTELSRFRRERLGFVFQFFHLLPTLSVLENVLLQGRLAGMPESALHARAHELLGRVGLSARKSDKPDVLSGGERQRIALARALVTRPALVLADEPTGNLDSASSAEVLKLLSELVRENKSTLVLATHSAEAAAIAGRIVRLKDGTVQV
ncbi:MAG TPA: ABC transporter ATP-binding protein [Planctomycetota bacterium]|nr:ABC transporter ATP-binding protein [Planctomycetota bacterium]